MTRQGAGGWDVGAAAGRACTHGRVVWLLHAPAGGWQPDRGLIAWEGYIAILFYTCHRYLDTIITARLAAVQAPSNTQVPRVRGGGGGQTAFKCIAQPWRRACMAAAAARVQIIRHSHEPAASSQINRVRMLQSECCKNAGRTEVCFGPPVKPPLTPCPEMLCPAGPTSCAHKARCTCPSFSANIGQPIKHSRMHNKMGGYVADWSGSRGEQTGAVCAVPSRVSPSTERISSATTPFKSFGRGRCGSPWCQKQDAPVRSHCTRNTFLYPPHKPPRAGALPQYVDGAACGHSQTP